MSFQKNDQVMYKVEQETGTCTGNIHVDSITGKKRYQVRFDASKVLFISEENLEGPLQSDDPIALMEKGLYGGIKDLRRIMYRHRLSGTLTNIMYSMNNSSTKYMPHQFRPVLKFLESSTERLLIADEVGLGKTIEACYIWNELVARRDARRLLIVAPAILTEKWRSDLNRLFDIPAEIADCAQVTQKVNDAVKDPRRTRFALVTSLEGLRYAMHQNGEFLGKRGKFNKLLEENAQTSVFDLIIIDEAHYLRNRGTASYQTGERLRDTASAMILLSATPVQNKTDDLFNLLSLLSPEDFPDFLSFDHLVKENSTVVRFVTDIEKKADMAVLEEDFRQIAETDYFGNDPDISLIHEHLDEIMQNKELNTAKGADETLVIEAARRRIEAVRILQNKYFYNSWVTRSRKRDVEINKSMRRAVTKDFCLSPYEKNLYDTVSRLLKAQIDESGDRFCVFRLMARQRQMASSIPAAFDAWSTDSSMQNLLYEDFGIIENEDDEDIGSAKKEKSNSSPEEVELKNLAATVDVAHLGRLDTKYQALLKTIKEILDINPKEKIILFSYFRNTIAYLQKRLNEDGVESVAIRGGMGNEKYEIIRQFQNDSQINVMISSEVGSEGIDLQFANVEINYDLPWNPMRLEQRIGRIDRIGQESPVIRIFNMSCNNTVEDRVLSRLYDKIEIFKQSIGDLEDILGNTVEEIAEDMLNPKLSPEEVEEKADQKINALVSQRKNNEKLEEKAGELVAYRDFILGEIKDAHNARRYITPGELIYTVKDFLGSEYPGSDFFEGPIQSSLYVKLSEEANEDLHQFIMTHNYRTSDTNLGFGMGKVLCLFDKKKIPEIEKKRQNLVWETVDINHPMVKWIIATLEKQMYNTLGSIAISLKRQEGAMTPFSAGDYVFYIQRWTYEGVRKTNELHYFMGRIGEKEEDAVELLDNEVQIESTIQNAMMYGSNLGKMPFINGNLEDRALATLQSVHDAAWAEFDCFSAQIKQENSIAIGRQITYIVQTANRKEQNLLNINRKIEEQMHEQPIQSSKNLAGVLHMNEVKLARIKAEKDRQVSVLKKREENEANPENVMVGILRVEA